MVPVALGSQTNGSVIRPASFCGVYGFKPTHGLIPRHGVLPLSRTLDTVGVFARTLDDVALLAEELVGFDERDPDSRPRARIPFREVAAEEPPLTPMFALVRTSRWDRADRRHAGGVRGAGRGSSATAWRRSSWSSRATRSSGTASSWKPRWRRASTASGTRGGTGCPTRSGPSSARGREVRALDYQLARARAQAFAEGLAEMFMERYDAILTPAAPGEAPRAASSRPAIRASARCGPSPACPRITLPLMHGANGLPIGVQLVGPRDGDARLLRTARWLASRVEAG